MGFTPKPGKTWAGLAEVSAPVLLAKIGEQKHSGQATPRVCTRSKIETCSPLKGYAMAKSAKTEARTLGRPSKYSADYGEQVIAWGGQGWTLPEMAAAFGVSRQTLNDWTNRHQDFSEALKIARTASEAYGARLGRENWLNPKFNTPLWCRFMASNHGWVMDGSKVAPDEGPRAELRIIGNMTTADI